MNSLLAIPSVKKLIIVRHGNYDGSNGHLSESGQRQIRDLAIKLRPFMQSRKKVMIASPMRRTVQTAEILEDVFRIKFITDIFLQTEDGSLPYHKAKAALDFLKVSDANLVIFVTHFEYGIDFLPFFLQRVFGKFVAAEAELPRGGALVIHCRDGSSEVLQGLSN